MRASLTGFAVALLTTVTASGMAGAQPSYPCTETNDNLPNPYRLVANWASPPRPWMPVNAVAVDPNNNLWAVDRCETDDCVPVIELGPDGKTRKNFGAGLFVEPHQAAIDKDGNLWVADAAAKGGKGMQVTKLSPDGRVLLKLGKPGLGTGESGLAIDKNDMLYVADSQSSDNQGAANYNPGCKRGIRVGSVKDGKVTYFIPPPVPLDPKMQPPIGIVVDGNGAIYAASDDQMDIKKYVKN